MERISLPRQRDTYLAKKGNHFFVVERDSEDERWIWIEPHPEGNKTIRYAELENILQQMGETDSVKGAVAVSIDSDCNPGDGPLTKRLRGMLWFVIFEHWYNADRGESFCPSTEYPTNICSRCGLHWPGMFMVPDEEWEYYIRPRYRNTMICEECYLTIRQIIDNRAPVNKGKCSLCSQLETSGTSDKVRKCAFESGVFDEANRNCGTIEALHKSSGGATQSNQGCTAELLNVPFVSGGPSQILLLWASAQESEEKVIRAWEMYGEGPESLKLKTAEAVIAANMLKEKKKNTDQQKTNQKGEKK